ncbi:hypothetical protein AB4Y63_09430 [Leifsonia sp. YAF41]|uniref:hypothetical protein n=1 Tax=Leifsonia sp. YAF41 TaxID=3233086 RepID=UPI003F9AF90F
MGKNAGILTALAIVMVCGVAGCAVVPPEAETTRAATVAPTPTAEPVVEAAWPVQLVPTTCEQVVPQPTIDAVFGEPLALDYTFPSGLGTSGFGSAAAENSGSLLCVWGAGEGDEIRAVIVDVVPRAVAIDERRSIELDGSPMGAPVGYCEPEGCAVRGIVDEYWMEATIWGADSMAEGARPAAQPVFDSVIAAVTALAPSADPVWPASAESWPSSCEEFASPETIADALNLPGASFTTGFYLSPSNVELGEIVSARGLVCGIASEGGGRSGRILTLPESGNRFAAARDQAVLSDLFEAVEISGLESGSAFVMRNAVNPSMAALEMNLRGTWVSLSMSTGTVEQGDPAALLLNLANALAED